MASHLSLPQRLQEEERLRDRLWDQQRVEHARETLLLERRGRRRQREVRRALDGSNLGLAKEQLLQ